MDEADRWFAQSETARASQGGVAVCVHLRRLQPAPNSEAEGRVCVKPGADAPAAAATAGSMASGDKISISTWRATRLQLAQPSFFRRLLEPLLALNTVSDPQITPDGSSIAYVVRSVNTNRNAYDSEIRIGALG